MGYGTDSRNRRLCLNSEASSTRPSLAAKLRPDGTLVAVSLAGRAAGCSAAGNAGAAAHESALFGAAGPCHVTSMRDLDLWHARYVSRQDRCTWRGIRPAADWLDYPQRNFPLSTHLRCRTIQSAAREPHGYHPGPAAAASVNRLQLRRILRGRGWIWYTGGCHGSGPDRLGLRTS